MFNVINHFLIPLQTSLVIRNVYFQCGYKDCKETCVFITYPPNLRNDSFLFDSFLPSSM